MRKNRLEFGTRSNIQIGRSEPPGIRKRATYISTNIYFGVVDGDNRSTINLGQSCVPIPYEYRV